MSISDLTFTKDWTKAEDFPTHESSERQVRADIQLLYDEIKNFINQQIVTTINTIAQAVEDFAEGTIADGSVTTAKLDDEAVTTEKIAPGAVDSEQLAPLAVRSTELADEAVTRSKIKDGEVIASKLSQVPGAEAVVTAAIRNYAVTLAKLANNSVDRNKIIDGEVTLAKLAANSVDRYKIIDGEVTLDKLANNSVDRNKIIDGEVTAAKIAEGAVQHRHIAADAVGTDQIADWAVNNWKIDDDAVDFRTMKGFACEDVQSGGQITLTLSPNARGILFMISRIRNNPLGGGSSPSSAVYAISAPSAGSSSVARADVLGGDTMGATQATADSLVLGNASTTMASCLLITLFGTITMEVEP